MAYFQSEGLSNRNSRIKRDYPTELVEQLRGSLVPECTLAKRGAERLWSQITAASKQGDGYIQALGTLTGTISSLLST